jgi:hypothetical protein
MRAWLALTILMGEPGALATGGTQPPTPPLVGQPREFFGAVGGPFIVEQVVDRNELVVEEPLTLTVRVTGGGTVPRPPLGTLEAYKAFAVDDLGDRVIDSDRPRREFDYRLRPRTADVKAVPRLKFVYFNPQISTDARGYQTRYADEVPLTVKPRPSTAAAVEVPEWILQEWQLETEESERAIQRFVNPSVIDICLDRALYWLASIYPNPDASKAGRRLLTGLALFTPPLLCVIWYVAWRRRNPDAARLASLRRSRAAALALRSLRATAGDTARHVSETIREYLHGRAGLPPTATTPAEISTYLRATGYVADRTAAVENLLCRCDYARFAPIASAESLLTSDAERLILDWEVSS